VTSKSKQNLVIGTAALLGVVAFVLTRRSGGENPVKTGADMIARLINLVLLCSMFAAARLTRPSEGSWPPVRSLRCGAVRGLSSM
jgi:hypothetical protein